jgi:dTMP kinase
MFIVIEGIDGSGKSTQIELVAQALRKSLVPTTEVQTVKFPVYDSPTGSLIQKMLQGGLRSKETCTVFQALMATNRREFAYNYDPNVGTILLADRYTLSGLVYGLAQGLQKDWLDAINLFLPEPTVTIFLDVPPDESFSRRPERTDSLEADPNFIRTIYDLYKQHLPLGTHIIDGTRPVSRVTQEIVDRILLVNQSLTYLF